MPSTSDWKRLLEAGMQFSEMRRAQARQLASDLVAQGHIARDQVQAAVEEILEMSRRRREELRELVRSEVRRQLGALGLATKDDLARLERKLATAKKAPAKRKAPTKKKAAARKAPAKRASKKATAPASREV